MASDSPPLSLAPPPIDLRTTYDVVIVGSGAAGGMAAHTLAQHGLNVALLEAGKRLNLEEELRSTEWPYEHPRRGDMPPGHRALALDEYNVRQTPYGQAHPAKKLYSYVQGWRGPDYSKSMVVDEKEHPFTGSRYAWVRTRALGGKTLIWGRHALRMSEQDFKAARRDGYGEDWPLSYTDIAPYYDKVDRLLGISGHAEKLPHLPDSLFQRATRLTPMEVRMRERLAKVGRVLTPYRAGVATDGVPHNKYRSRCGGRGACSRRVGGCDIHAAFDSPTGLIYPALDTGKLALRTGAIVREVLVDSNTGRARGVSFIDATTRKDYEVKARVVMLAASTLETARLMLLSKSQQHPGGIGNTSGHVGHNFCEHVMGPNLKGLMKDMVGRARANDDGRPGQFYIPEFRNVTEKQPSFLRSYGFQGRSGSNMYPDDTVVPLTPGFGKAFKKNVRERAGAFVTMSGFGETLPRFENHVALDAKVKDRWGIPVLRFNIKFGENEKKMCADMVTTAHEIFEASGIEVLDGRTTILPEGWSIHELGTARMGSDPKTSVLNQFQQSHDVKNLFVVDGSSHVSASCKNPTWTIMALAWRSCDHLASELRKGNLG